MSNSYRFDAKAKSIQGEDRHNERDESFASLSSHCWASERTRRLDAKRKINEKRKGARI